MAYSGTKLWIVSTSIAVGGRVMTARCEVSCSFPSHSSVQSITSKVWDKEQEKILISAVHSKVNPQYAKEILSSKM
jgi:hypothetical protein